MGWDAFFQGIFLIQELNQHLLHCRWILYCWATGEAFQLSSVVQSSLTFCNLIDCGMPGFSVHHQHPELTQLMSVESVMPSNYLIFCCPLLLPAIFPSIRVFPNESVLHIRWPKYSNFSFSASVLPMNVQDWSPLGWTGWISFQSKGLSRVFSNTIVQKHQFFGAQLSLYSKSHIHTWLLKKL